MVRMVRVVRFTVLGLGRCRGCWLVDRLWFDDFVVVLVLVRMRRIQKLQVGYRQRRNFFGDRMEAAAALLLVILL